MNVTQADGEEAIPAAPSLRNRARLLAQSLIVLSFLCATVIYTWPVASWMGRGTAIFSGDSAYVAYVLAWGQRAVLHDPLHAFGANFFYPLEGAIGLSDNLLFVSLMTLPLAPLGNPILVYNAALLASFLVPALIWYAVLRRWGLARPAAWIGGAVFGFLPWRFGQISHGNLLFTWWIPVALGSVEAWTRQPRWGSALLTGLAVAGCFYSGVYHCYMLALFLVPFGLIGLFAQGFRGRPWLMMLLQGAAGLAVAGIIIWPGAASHHAIRLLLGDVNPLASIVPRGAALADYARSSGFNRAWRWLYFRLGPNPYSDIPWEHELFLGLVPLLASISLLFLLWRHREGEGAARWADFRRLTLMLTAGGFFLFVFSLGPEFHWRGKATGIRLPYAFLYRWLPGFEAMRVPARGALFVGLSLSALAALAIHGWMEVLGRWRPALAHAFAVVSLALVAAELSNFPMPVSENPDYSRLLKVQREIAKLPRGPEAILPMTIDMRYLAPLSTTPHFYPLVDGISSHLPPSNGYIFETLSQPSWGHSQGELLHWLGLRYLLVDEKAWGPGAAESLAQMKQALIADGFVIEERRFPKEFVTLLQIGAPDSKAEVLRSISGEFDVSFGFYPKLTPPQIHAYLKNLGPPGWIPKDARTVKVKVTGLDAGGQKIWRSNLTLPLPHFAMRGQFISSFRVNPKEEDVSRTAAVRVRFRQPLLKINHRQDSPYNSEALYPQK